MIAMSEYAKRRKNLMQKLGKDAVAILPAAPEILRNGDATYPYRQNSDFVYLTGFAEPEAVMVLIPGRKEGQFVLFNRERNKDREIWDGPRAGQQGARKTYLADQSFAFSDFEKQLPELLAGKKTVHFPIGLNHGFETRIIKALKLVRQQMRKGLAAPGELKDISATLHEMRLIKDPGEIKLMQKAVDITAKAHLHAMQICKPGMYEYELEAALTYEFQRHGARYPAYSSIVGAGKNACVLHYTANNQKLKNNDLVLIDAGAEYEHYAADITRTFPANGKFTPEQRDIYQLVLEAQLAAIKLIKPGALWSAAQACIIKTITSGLIDLKILKGRVDDLIEKQAYLPFYMHGSGHWLGLDVHDVGQYRDEKNKWRNLKPGMVLTVEPGIYISAGTAGVHDRWHNIGIRIEDDVLVTSKGNDVLSKAIPKTIDAIEAVMAK